MKNTKGINDEVIKEINLGLLLHLQTRKVNDVLHDSYNPIYLEEYEEYTIMDYLRLIKLEKLFELKKISKDEYLILKEMFSLNIILSREIGKELYKELMHGDLYSKNSDFATRKENNKKLENLKNKKKEIDNVLKEYKLLEPDTIYLEKIISLIIKDEYKEDKKQKRKLKKSNN